VEQLCDTAPFGCCREQHLGRISAECESGAKTLNGAICTRTISLVHDHEIGRLEQSCLHCLHLISTLWPFDQQDEIGESHNAKVGLTCTNRLNKEEIKSCRLNQ
jgi:hypothetical protein